MAIERLYPVEIRLGSECTQYSAAFQTQREYAAAWYSVLRKAHGKAIVRCLCPGKGAKRISIHYISDADTFYLARFPETRHEHSEDCIYHSRSTYSDCRWDVRKKAVENLPGGGIEIKLPIGVRKRSFKGIDRDKPRRFEPVEDDFSPRTSKPATGLVDLLYLLWDKSRLNVWYPSMEGKRTCQRVAYWVKDAARKVIVGGLTIDNILCISAMKDSIEEGTNRKTIEFCRRMQYRPIVIAPLARYSGRDPGEVGYIPIRGFAGIPILRISADLWHEIRERFQFEVSHWLSGLLTMAVIQTDPPYQGVLNIVDMALMAVSEEWIPVQSDSDRQEENRLRMEGVPFKKTPDGFLLLGQNVPA